MATIVNNPSSDTGSSFRMFAAVILILGFIIILFYFGLPMIRQGSSTTQSSEVNLPPAENKAPNINVPDKVDVNLNQK